MIGPAADPLSLGDPLMTSTTPSWRNSPNIAIHPAAEIFPLLPEVELADLARDIKTNRLREKVAVIIKGNRQLVIDGRNRLDALERAGFCIVDEHGRLLKSVCLDLSKGGDLDLVDPTKVEAYIISKNIHRRHLNADQKRELAARLLKADPNRSNRAIAGDVKLDDKTVASMRQTLEASAEIPHIAPTERVDAGGRKRARKTVATTRSNKQPANEQPIAVSDQPAGQVLVAAEPPSIDAIAEPQDQPVPTTPQFSLRDLPFEEVLASVKEWFAALPISQQGQVLEALESENATISEPSAAPEPTVAEQDQDESAMGGAEPAQPEEVGDRASRLVAQLNALPGVRPKWCRERLDQPEDAINHLKHNEAWRDASDWLVGFMACSAEDQAAIRVQVGAA